MTRPNLTIRQRTLLCTVVGALFLALSLYFHDNGFISFLTFVIGAPLFLWLGVAVAFGRWFLQAINYSKSALFEDYDRHDLTGQRAAFSRWWLGMNRDGSFRP